MCKINPRGWKLKRQISSEKREGVTAGRGQERNFWEAVKIAERWFWINTI